MFVKCIVITLSAFALVLFAGMQQAVSQTSLGTVSVGHVLTACPNRGFVSNIGMVCYPATLQGCPGNDDMEFVYGVAPPATGTLPHGTIVFFAGGGGNDAADGPDQTAMLASYAGAGFQVVQIAWGPGTNMQDGQDWELTNANGGSNQASILAAACRPSTFLNWVRNGNSGVGNGIWATYHGGMCAHGHSAGSGALGYALAWYKAGAPAPGTNGSGYLDHAVFTAGPVFSDISQGCQVPNNSYTYICESSSQLGCTGWSAQDPPGFFLECATGYKSSVNMWSGNTAPASCANNSQATSSSQNSNWYQMSILYNQGTQPPSFTYPATGLSAWECETVHLVAGFPMARGSRGADFIPTWPVLDDFPLV